MAPISARPCRRISPIRSRKYGDSSKRPSRVLSFTLPHQVGRVLIVERVHCLCDAVRQNAFDDVRHLITQIGHDLPLGGCELTENIILGFPRTPTYPDSNPRYVACSEVVDDRLHSSMSGGTSTFADSDLTER